MIAYKDFVGVRTVVLGQVVTSPGARKAALASAVEEANGWLEAAGRDVAVLSVETVSDGRNPSCVRVWYSLYPAAPPV